MISLYCFIAFQVVQLHSQYKRTVFLYRVRLRVKTEINLKLQYTVHVAKTQRAEKQYDG